MQIPDHLTQLTIPFRIRARNTDRYCRGILPVTQFVQMIAMVLIGALTFPATVFAGGEECASVCDEYKNAVIGKNPNNKAAGNLDTPDMTNNRMSFAFVNKHCPMPTATTNGSGPIDPTSGFVGATGSTTADSTGSGGASSESLGLSKDFTISGNDKWNTCYQTLMNDWNQVGPGCAAIQLLDDTKTDQWALAVIYTAATAVCTGACIWGWTQWACTVAALTALGFDIGFSVDLASKGADLTAPYKNLGGTLAQGVIGAGTAAAGAMASVVSVGYGNLSTQWSAVAQQGSEAAVGATKAGESGLADTGKAIGENAGKQAGENAAKKTATCYLSAALVAAGAGFKWASLAQLGGAKDAQCEEIKKHNLADVKIVEDPSGSTASSPPGAAPGGPAVAPGGDPAKGGNTSSNTGGNFADPNKSAATPSAIQAKAYAALSGGVLDKMLNNIPFKNQLGEALKGMSGLTLADIGKRLSAGESPNSIIGSIPGLGGFAAATKQLEKDILSGKIKPEPGQSTYGSFGGRGGSSATKAAPNPFGFLGQQGGALSGGPSETAFEKMKKNPELLSGGDIWHEGYGGSIFQLVSEKLGKTRDRIDELEWETPLNRALLGLPAKK